MPRAARARGERPAQALISDDRLGRPGVARAGAGGAEIARAADALFANVSTLESPARIGFRARPCRRRSRLNAGVASVVLDRLQDAGNVGSILRSAAAFGFAQVIALKGSVALWSPKVLRAGMGAHFALRLVESATRATLDALGVPLWRPARIEATRCRTRRCRRLAPGCSATKGRASTSELLARCAQVVRIPQPGGEESLNVAAAAAVCLYESARRR